MFIGVLQSSLFKIVYKVLTRTSVVEALLSKFLAAGWKVYLITDFVANFVLGFY